MAWFALGYSTAGSMGLGALGGSTSLARPNSFSYAPRGMVRIHGNSLASPRPTWGYKLYSNDGTFLKNGITSQLRPQLRYTKGFMQDKYFGYRRLFPNRRAAYQWEFQENQILQGPLNRNMPLRMSDSKNILGCFVSGPSLYHDANQEQEKLAEEQGSLFRSYIWGTKSISEILKKLKHEDYGKDIVLILFQFYLNPISYELQGLKEIENYRKSERSIGIPIIVTDENFFNKSDEDRYKFLHKAILEKIDLLAEVVRKKKLDTKIDLLRKDLQNILTEHLLMM